MDNSVKLAKVKAILVALEHTSAESIKSRVMAILSPQEANQIYNHFTIVEPNFIKTTYKVDVWEVIPRADEYWAAPKKLIDFDDDNDEPYWL